jgi:hypothetical protein
MFRKTTIYKKFMTTNMLDNDDMVSKQTTKLAYSADLARDAWFSTVTTVSFDVIYVGIVLFT